MCGKLSIGFLLPDAAPAVLAEMPPVAVQMAVTVGTAVHGKFYRTEAYEYDEHSHQANHTSRVCQHTGKQHSDDKPDPQAVCPQQAIFPVFHTALPFLNFIVAHAVFKGNKKDSHPWATVLFV